jgi:biotin carboxyl carrier protein
MEKEKEISDILSLYESILNTKLINEVSNTSSGLLGGKTFNIPNDGAHAGQSGWQSANAWDIMAAVGTPVYAIVGGTVITFNDYGATPIKKDGKTLFGVGFTVDSDNRLPDVYYAHLKDVTVKQGDKIKCGQLIGYVIDFPNNNSDHVHIGVESGNIRQFLTKDGSIKCAEGQTGSDSSENAYAAATAKAGTSSASMSVFNNPNAPTDSITRDIAAQTGEKISPKPPVKTESHQIKENKNFGNDVSNRYGRLIIPKDTNPRIKSPIAGEIINKYTPTCVNQITVKSNGKNPFYLQFCGISSPSVKVGQSISRKDILGITETDVEVTMYDSSWNTMKIDDNLKSNNKDDDDNNKKDRESNKSYADPLTAIVANLPGKIFNKVLGDKYDKAGNRVQKRWGGVSDKEDVDPWLLDLIKSPFKKKVTENIERIKKLL